MVIKEIIDKVIYELSNRYQFKVVDDEDGGYYDEYEILLEFNRKHLEISKLDIECTLMGLCDCTYHVAVYSNIVAILINPKHSS